MAHDHHVIVIGAGTFGLSTALHLLRSSDFKSKVTVIDPYEVPSPLSAGNDVNKILQSSVEDRFYSELALESLELWSSDPVFKPAFNETGIIYCSAKDIDYLETRKQFLKEKGIQFSDLQQSDEFARLVPDTTKTEHGGRFKDWQGIFQQEKCGWTYAVKALELMATEVRRLGGEFIVDAVDEILFNQSDNSVRGVKTYLGQLISANQVVIAAGAQSYKLLDFKGQLLAKCWTVGHIKLSDEEAAKLKNSPVVLNLDHGFFFEPDANNEIKFCNEFPGYINWSDQSKESVPLYRNQVPKEAEDYMRAFLQEVFPDIATRPFSVAKICWCTDTPDRHFLIGSHPEHKGLILGTGDSGQGFKYCPIIGRYIASVVINGDESLDKEKREAWKWRPETAVGRDIYALQNREGGDNTIKDLKDIDEWTDGKSSGVDISSLKI